MPACLSHALLPCQQLFKLAVDSEEEQAAAAVVASGTKGKASYSSATDIDSKFLLGFFVLHPLCLVPVVTEVVTCLVTGAVRLSESGRLYRLVGRVSLHRV